MTQGARGVKLYVGFFPPRVFPRGFFENFDIGGYFYVDTHLFCPCAASARRVVSPAPPVGAVSAHGATRDRLLALRGGLLSRCASVFPEAGEQSAWFGGPLGGGMHAPELLEAMLLTGAQLGDEELRREALRLCGRVVERQREDGSFGAPGETFAARGRMLRALCAA